MVNLMVLCLIKNKKSEVMLGGYSSPASVVSFYHGGFHVSKMQNFKISKPINEDDGECMRAWIM